MSFLPLSEVNQATLLPLSEVNQAIFKCYVLYVLRLLLTVQSSYLLNVPGLPRALSTSDQAWCTKLWIPERTE